jgi:hypothetical protein
VSRDDRRIPARDDGDLLGFQRFFLASASKKLFFELNTCEDIAGETGVPLIRFTPETIVMRDQSYTPPRGKTATPINPVATVRGEITTS